MKFELKELLWLILTNNFKLFQAFAVSVRNIIYFEGVASSPLRFISVLVVGLCSRLPVSAKAHCAPLSKRDRLVVGSRYRCRFSSATADRFVLSGLVFVSVWFVLKEITYNWVKHSYFLTTRSQKTRSVHNAAGRPTQRHTLSPCGNPDIPCPLLQKAHRLGGTVFSGQRMQADIRSQ